MAEFVPLAQWLREAAAPSPGPALSSRARAPALGSSAPAPAPCPEERALEATASEDAIERSDSPAEPGRESVLFALGSELGIVRIAAGESFEDAARRLLERLACDVLGRELALAPCELGGLIAAARAELEALEPLCLITAPGERAEFPRAFPCRTDPALAPGDLFVEASGGAIDLRLRARVQRALEGLGE